LSGRILALLARAAFFSLAAAPVHASPGAAGTVAVATVQEIGGCSNALPWSERSRIRAVGREEGELVVSVLANAACGGLRPDSPQVELSGSTLSLSWVWVKPDNVPLAACLCTRHLEFRVSGVPPGDVVVNAAERTK
jgi:hypothetical protein